MTIRAMRPGDRENYLRLARDFYHSPAVLAPVPDEHLTRTFDELLRSHDYVEGYLFELNGCAVGYALLSRSYSQESGGFVLWLEELYVEQALRGRGFGREFLQRMETDHPDARAFRLEVEPENERAAKLYRQLGYQPLAYRSYRKSRC